MVWMPMDLIADATVGWDFAWLVICSCSFSRLRSPSIPLVWLCRWTGHLEVDVGSQ